ncbi:MAG: MoxR family ATPase [Oscillospiraceae bacterium]|nr:MoxR family ATPase [Oscillospiraceae bacterium]
MVKELTEKITENISKAVRGKDKQIKLVCAAMFAGGHVLLEDVPGTGKTLLARSLAKSVGGDFRRIQFTPDLLPSDVTGINFFNAKAQEFVLRKGPVFTNILLADEINRATPRTQSALLECMEEHQTTIDGDTMKLETPFFVIATQNPTEIQGTYPLPEAQLDRFMIRLALGYPDREEEIAVIGGAASYGAEEKLSSVCAKDEIIEAQNEVNACKANEAVCGYIADIAVVTRKHASVKLGLSTRGAAALKRMSCALAAIDGRDYAMPQDVKEAAPYVISHRLIYKGYSHNGANEDTVRQIIESVPVPTE